VDATAESREYTVEDQVKNPKPVYKEETPGEWIFDEGDPGYAGSLYEPPDPGYAPYIFVKPPEGFGYDEDEEFVKIAEIFMEPCLPALDHSPESEYDEGLIAWGDHKRNGKLMASAPTMWKFLREIAYAPEGEVRAAVARASLWARRFEAILEQK